MTEIILTGKKAKGLKILIDDEDIERVSKYSINFGSNGYSVTSLPIQGIRKMVYLHKVILPDIPKGLMVDHINNNKLDNRKCNLRICTNQQNQWNQKKSIRGTSKFKGVNWYKLYSKWVAKIKFNGKKLHIGYFEDEIHAAMAYDLWAKELFG